VHQPLATLSVGLSHLDDRHVRRDFGLGLPSGATLDLDLHFVGAVHYVLVPILAHPRTKVQEVRLHGL